MPRTLLVDAVGSCIAIDLSALDDGDEAAVRAAWADAAADAGARAVATVTPYDTDRSSMLSALSQQVTLAAIEAARGRAWMLHAAGIATPDGDVVVLVGPSGRGKTTASRALGAVYGYVSDETIAIDHDGRVWPYRKPLSVIEDPAAPKTQHPPSALGLRPLPSAELRVAAVVLLDRDEEHPESPLVEVTDLGTALEALVSQTSFLHDQPAPLRFIAALATATGGVRTVKYRDAATLPSVIADLIRPSAAIVLPERPAHIAPVADPEHLGPRFSRVEVVDEVSVEDPDRIALLTITGHQGHVTLLGGIGPAVWRAADGATLRQLTDAAVTAHDPPEDFDAESAVLAAVGLLLDAGLLSSDEPVIARRDEVVWVDVDDPATARPVGPDIDDQLARAAALTGSTALIWEWLDEPRTMTQLIVRAMMTGSDPAGDAVDDVPTAVAELIESGLLEERVLQPGAPTFVVR
ncbi:hypothetical protein SAMN04487846_0980 [Microbacterium sp. cf046]|uniref:hypothetical protein n=1 Tax=Microbacterium sp. cf046 TaxID=1761803 RepID=UPI0008ED6098|nr:hypothetical protein [Microbacterium sp. cf046]SFR94573.1 hypothetical protein SAMN04487846_0980 [Microbacterium sp. cf046]